MKNNGADVLLHRQGSRSWKKGFPPGNGRPEITSDGSTQIKFRRS